MSRILAIFRHWRQPHILPPLYAFFMASGTLLTLLSVMGSKSDPRNALILGYSLERILVAAGLILLVFAFLVLTWKLLRSPECSRHLWGIVFERKSVNNATLWVSLAAFLLCWIGLFFPSYRLAGSISGYIDRLIPVMIWGAVLSAVTLLVILLERRKGPIHSIVSTNKNALWMGLVALTIFIFIGVLILITGVGVRQPEDYWYGAGVPVLGLQILFSMLLGTFVMWLESRQEIKNPFKLDSLICIAIWMITAWLWAREPLRPNYFMPDTAKNMIYPFSDSATFDMGSQFALIGQGIFNGQYFDRALYSAFLTYLHAVVGQNTEQLMTAQSVIYAVFPVIVYLLGREIHSRALGFSAAFLILFRGVNALAAATWIDLASPKTMLTDFPTAIGIALMIFFVLKWLKGPSKGHFAVWAGGMLGMTFMLRTHVLLLLPFLLIYILIRVQFRLKNWGIASLLLILGMVTATLPWDIRNRSNGAPMFYGYYSRIQVILRARYGMEEDTYIPSTISDVSGSRPTYARFRRATVSPLETGLCQGRVCAIANHYFHNLVTSVLFLPTSFVFDDLWNTVKVSAPYWKQDWTGGGFGITKGILLALNLAMISLGLGAAWERNKFIGLLPAVIFLVYLLSNSLAFTSGGRYITPVDWIICIYYVLGLMQLVLWGLRLAGAISPSEVWLASINTQFPALPAVQSINILKTLVLVFMLGALVPLAELPFERRYQETSADATLAVLEQGGWLDQAGLVRDDLSEFLSDPQAQMIVGRSLYPRYYRAGKGEPKRIYPYLPLDYPRLAFMTIGPFDGGVQSVIIPGEKPRFNLNAADVVVIGCENSSFLDALAVFILTEPPMVYLRSPRPALQCPFPPPD
ncbi:MAG: hypothetical protein ACYC6R_03745 [Anaerolineales bacterium]